MKNLFYPLLMATAFVATACTNNLEDDVTPVDPNGKTPISFVAENNNQPVTRAGFEGDDKSYTEVALHIRSTKSSSDIRETRTLAKATHVAKESTLPSDIKQDDSYYRYWDDAHGRDSKLSVFAIAVPCVSTLNLASKLSAPKDGATWESKALDESVEWNVSTDQSVAGKIDAEDLVYSNNIKSDGSNDKRLKFKLDNSNITDGPGKFEQGTLEFHHALSRITVTLEKGTGYGDGSFKFPVDNENKVVSTVSVLGVPTSGNLNLEDGTWAVTASDGISKMYTTATTSNAACTLKAQFLSGYEITDGNKTTNMLEFVIDDNKYYVNQDQVFDALNNASEGKSNMTKLETGKVTMEQGLNYIFKIKVNKTSIINVSATVKPFLDVTADEIDPSNARINLDNLWSPSGTASSKFDLYRALDESKTITDEFDGTKWEGNYDGKATLTSTASGWKTDWYFESNKTYYHFRTVNENTKIKGATDKDVADYFYISSGSVASTDPHWGAPMTKEPVYDVADGYKDCLSHAIGASSDNIKITDMHVMCNISIKLTTPTTGNDNVTLAGTTVYITRISKAGTVLMGTGKVIPTANYEDQLMDGNSEGTLFTYAVVPQALVRSADPSDDDYVGITIVTGDNNQYYIVKKLSEIKATSVKQNDTDITDSNQAVNTAITRWFPGHTYTYTFNLKKTGIDKVTCTVEGWKEVKTEEKTITLED